MKKTMPLLAGLVLLTSCRTKPPESAQMTRIETQDLRLASYNDFVKRRTLELERIGGPYKNDGTAAQQADQEAKDRFGEIIAGWEKTVTAADAKKMKEQAAFNDQLQKMQRRKGD